MIVDDTLEHLHPVDDPPGRAIENEAGLTGASMVRPPAAGRPRRPTTWPATCDTRRGYARNVAPGSDARISLTAPPAPERNARPGGRTRDNRAPGESLRLKKEVR